MNYIKDFLRKIYKATNSDGLVGLIFGVPTFIVLVWLSIVVDSFIPDILGFVEVIYFFTNVAAVIFISFSAGLWASIICQPEKED